jgi:putative flippase GtrA
MRQSVIKNSRQVGRFGLVGLVNTAIDFVTLFSMHSLGLPVGIANIISTSTAFTFSFFANKRYTFRASGGNMVREILFFVAVTLFGLWVLQNLIIQLTLPWLSEVTGRAESGLFIAKLLATCVSLVWNYLFYARLVFKKH